MLTLPAYFGSHRTESEVGVGVTLSLLTVSDVTPQVQATPYVSPATVRFGSLARLGARSLTLGMSDVSILAIRPSSRACLAKAELTSTTSYAPGLVRSLVSISCSEVKESCTTVLPV